MRRGVAEYLAAAPQLLEEWRAAWNLGAHPRAAALVAGAVDARRAGFHRALPEDLLHALHERYLESRGGGELRPESWAEALEWATTPLHAASSLLLAQPDGGYLAFDYLPNTLDAQAPPPRIPEATWRILLEHADSAGALDSGTAACEHQSRIAKTSPSVFTIAISSPPSTTLIGLPSLRSETPHARTKAADSGWLMTVRPRWRW